MLIHDKTGTAWTFIEKVTHPLRPTKVIVTLPYPGCVVPFKFSARNFADLGDVEDDNS